MPSADTGATDEIPCGEKGYGANGFTISRRQRRRPSAASRARTDPGSRTRIRPSATTGAETSCPRTTSSALRQSSSPVERSRATTFPGVCCSPTVATSARSPSTVTAPAIEAAEILRPANLRRGELDRGDVPAEVTDVGRGSSVVIGVRTMSSSWTGDDHASSPVRRSIAPTWASSPSSPAASEGDGDGEGGEADGEAVGDGPLSPKPSANTTIGPSAPGPIAGWAESPRSRSTENTSDPSSPSKTKTSLDPTTTIVPSSPTTGDDSPPVVAASSTSISSLLHATRSGTEGPSERPSCVGPPWNWVHSARAASGMPNTTTSVSQATVKERRDAPERWEARKAGHPSRSFATGCSGSERREPDEPPDLDRTQVLQRVDVRVRELHAEVQMRGRRRPRVPSPTER